METSIIIRTKNEEKWVGEVLKKLSEQTYKDFEIIVVDSGSTDKTLEIVRNYPVRLFQIKPEEFTYPYALNFGCRQAQAEKYFVFLSAHSVPISDTWLKDGISGFSLKENILGIYGYVMPLPDASIWEKIIFNRFFQNIRNKFRDHKEITKIGLGVLGFTNAIIKRDLWDKRKFNEEYGMGGEDGEWCGYWMNKGYIALRDRRLSVFHSHGLGLKGLIEQQKHWMDISRPLTYKELKYRRKAKKNG